jgi:predicted nucleic acid-binding protein
MIVDTSALLALVNEDERAHSAVLELVSATSEPLVVSPYVVAELDYLVSTRFGVAAELEVLRELAGGAWTLAAISEADLATAATVVEQYADQSIGVADACLVVLAEKFDTRTIATLDRRHFDVLRPLGGGRFEFVPR